MTRTVTAICLLLAWLLLAAAPGSANAGDWRFRRSYHSHDVPREWQARFPVPHSRSAYRPAYITPTFGIAVMGGYRVNRIQFNSGNSSDTTILYEGWLRAR